MNLFYNLSFRWKLTVPLVFIAFIMLVNSLLGMINVKSLGHASKEISHRYLPSVDFLVEADRDLYQALVAERSMIFVAVSSDEFKSLVKMHQDNIQQAHDRVGKFAALSTMPDTKPLLDEFSSAYEKWKKSTNEVLEQRQSDTRVGRNTAIEISFGDAEKQFEAMRDILDKLTEITLGKSEGMTREIDGVSASSQLMMGSGLVIGLIVTILTILFFPRLITRPLHEVVSRIEDISHGNGDLTKRLAVKSKDELGQLAGAFNNFLEKLHVLIGKIAGATSQVASAAEEMSAITSDNKVSIEKQRHAIEQVVTAVTQMSSTVQEVARNTNVAADAAQQADSDSEQTLSVMDETVGAIKQLADDVEDAAQVIKTLGKNSESIGKVLVVIKDIAEQTNLLALNAAIEAARAGEQGRGFAVVADEVRTLASRTQESTQEIQQMIESLQSGAQNAVAVMEKGRGQAQAGLEKAQKAGSSISSITTSVTRIRDMNDQIATSAEEQTLVTDEITHNIVHISDISLQTMDASSQTDDASQGLAKLAGELQSLVGQFKI